MANEYDTGYQYNRCTSRGICSINPATASLQEVILLYLKHAAYYGMKLEENGLKDIRIKNLVLNTISVLSSNYEISEANFNMINRAFKTEFPRILAEYNRVCSGEEKLDTESLLKLKSGLNDYIRYGEKEFNKRLRSISTEERNLYRILFILIKSLCVNILTYESFEKEPDDEVQVIYRVLNLLNSSKKTKEELKEIILSVAEKDCALMALIRKVQEEYYGEQRESEISFSTTKGKAVLVVGSNLRELEQILDVFGDRDIDVYTHDNMILAHTFPKFKEYKKLKGQFGQGMESCLLDFSTFPGPIILTRNSLFNIENLYRGRLYTTDFSYSKGVISIKNNDFSEVIKSAEESKGFKTGKVCDFEKIGFSVKQLTEEVNTKLSTGKYNHLIIVGSGGYSPEEKEYFKTFIKHIPENVLMLSLFCCEPHENVICVNAANDICGISRLFDCLLNNCSQNVSIFFPFSDKHTVSVIVNAAKYENACVFIGNWNRVVMNPDIMEGLKSAFNIFEVTTPKNDMNKLFDVK